MNIPIKTYYVDFARVLTIDIVFISIHNNVWKTFQSALIAILSFPPKIGVHM